MRVSTAWRWNGARWFVPVVFALSAYIANTSLGGNETGYATADLAAASLCLIFVGPLQAGFVAWRLAALSRFVAPLRPRRSGLAAVTVTSWPLLLGPPTAASLSLCLAAGLPNDRPSWAVLAMVFVTVLACGALGFLTARALPVVIAIPVVAAASYAWLALPGASTRILIRHLNSSFVGCCSTGSEPAQAMLVGSGAIVAVVVLGAVASVLSRQWARYRAVVVGPYLVLVLAAAGLCGVLAANASPGPLNLLAVQDRSTTQECREVAGAPVCVWPENRDRLDVVTQAVVDLDVGLAEYDLRAVGMAGEDARQDDAVDFNAPFYVDRETIVYSLAYGYVARQSTCEDGSVGRVDGAQVAFVGLVAGVESRQMRDYVGAEAVDEAAATLQGSASDARSWMQAFERDAARACDRGGAR